MLHSRTGPPLGVLAPAKGWTQDYLVAPTPLAGSNGLRLGPDGALFIAQCNGGTIGRLDLDARTVEVVEIDGGTLTGPDDLAFDSSGNMFITEVMGDRVSMRLPNGTFSVIAGNTPAANGITVHDDRIFMSEFNPDGRILEVFADGSAPRAIASGLMMPNALQRGPDGLLYFPLVPTGEIWRVPIDGGTPERVSGGLVMPTGVKFDPEGRLWAVEAATGALVRIDPASGTHVETRHVAPGADNFVFRPDGRMLVSHFTDGQIVEVDRSGNVEEIIPPGMLGPFGIAATARGEVLVADGSSIASVDASGRITRISIMIQPGAPGYTRGIAVDADGSLLVTNTGGQVARFTPQNGSSFLISDLDQAIGITPDGCGGAYLCEAGTGCVLRVSANGAIKTVTRGLLRPTDIHRLRDDSLIVSEAGAGRLLHLANGSASVILDGLIAPHGVTASSEGVFVLDYGARTLHLVPADGSGSRIVAANLPVGGSLGGTPQGLPGIAGILPGPILPFAGISAMPNGDIVIAADAVGGVVRLSRPKTRN